MVTVWEPLYSLSREQISERERAENREKPKLRAKWSIYIFICQKRVLKRKAEACSLMCCRCRSLSPSRILGAFHIVYTIEASHTSLEEHRTTILRTFSQLSKKFLFLRFSSVRVEIYTAATNSSSSSNSNFNTNINTNTHVKIALAWLSNKSVCLCRLFTL